VQPAGAIENRRPLLPFRGPLDCDGKPMSHEENNGLAVTQALTRHLKNPELFVDLAFVADSDLKPAPVPI